MTDDHTDATVCHAVVELLPLLRVSSASSSPPGAAALRVEYFRDCVSPHQFFLFVTHLLPANSPLAFFDEQRGRAETCRRLPQEAVVQTLRPLPSICLTTRTVPTAIDANRPDGILGASTKASSRLLLLRARRADRGELSETTMMTTTKPRPERTDMEATVKSCRRTVDTMAPSRHDLHHCRIRALGQTESSHLLAAQIGEKIARRGLPLAEI